MRVVHGDGCTADFCSQIFETRIGVVVVVGRMRWSGRWGSWRDGLWTLLSIESGTVEIRLMEEETRKMEVG